MKKKAHIINLKVYEIQNLQSKTKYIKISVTFKKCKINYGNHTQIRSFTPHSFVC